MTDQPTMTDAQLRARTEMLLAEAVQVANQLRIQTERLALAISQFHSENVSVQREDTEADRADR